MCRSPQAWRQRGPTLTLFLASRQVARLARLARHSVTLRLAGWRHGIAAGLLTARAIEPGLVVVAILSPAGLAAGPALSATRPTQPLSRALRSSSAGPRPATPSRARGRSGARARQAAPSGAARDASGPALLPCCGASPAGRTVRCDELCGFATHIRPFGDRSQAEPGTPASPASSWPGALHRPWSRQGPSPWSALGGPRRPSAAPRRRPLGCPAGPVE